MILVTDKEIVQPHQQPGKTPADPFTHQQEKDEQNSACQPVNQPDVQKREHRKEIGDPYESISATGREK